MGRSWHCLKATRLQSRAVVISFCVKIFCAMDTLENVFSYYRMRSLTPGAYTSCHSLGACAALLDMPRPATVLDFEGRHSAGGYGPVIATSAASITVEHVNPAPLVPGQSSLNLKISPLDAQGQIARGPPGLPIPYLVQYIVTSWNALCSSVGECSSMSLQPDVIMRADGISHDSSAQQQQFQLEYCQVGTPGVLVHTFLPEVSSAAISILPIECSACTKGQKRREVAVLPVPAYTCTSCQRNEYIVDSTNPDYHCQR
jgi:hypothetical protein